MLRALRQESLHMNLRLAPTLAKVLLQWDGPALSASWISVPQPCRKLIPLLELIFV